MKPLLRRARSAIKSLVGAPFRRDAFRRDAPRVPGAAYDSPDGVNWYAPAILSATTLGERATRPATLRAVIASLQSLTPDDYVRYLLGYYRAGLDRFGGEWRYADITTVLWAAAECLRPRRYLEIGVRRGRSMAMVAGRCPECAIIGFDLWLAGYAGMENPGPDFVRGELGKVGYRGEVELIGGNSQVTVPRWLRDHPDAFFDLITVDGDHSRRGAAQDLRAVLPRLAVGGVLVFDDIAHPQHRYLREVWQNEVGRDPRFATWGYGDLGYGVALAVRRE